MKKIKHIVFWLIVIGLILLLFSSHVIAEDDFSAATSRISGHY